MTAKKQFFKLLVLTMAIAVCSINVFSLIVANSTETAFDSTQQPDGGSAISDNVSLTTLVIEGAGYFLESHTQALVLLNRFEMSELKGIDYIGLKEAVDSAIEKMQKARDTYALLVQKAANIPYKQEIIDRLKEFDYNALQHRKNMIPGIMEQTAAYLKAGDIRGIYAKILDNTGEILQKLEIIKAGIYVEQFPEVNDMWRMNQIYTQSLLFGQYSAEVFYEIL